MLPGLEQVQPALPTAPAPTRRVYGESGQRSARGRVGRSPEYAAWNGAITRCHCPKDQRYSRYGGRGIKVCNRWRRSYDAFLEDMGRRPGPGYSLERKNNRGDYAPGNCRWATKKEQQWNRRDSTFLTFEGHTANLHYWATEFGLSHHTLRGRLRRGWPLERALNVRPYKGNKQCP